MDNKVISFRTPHLILAGFGASERLGQEVRTIGVRKALVVTDQGVIDSGTGEKVKYFLEKEHVAVEVFDRVISDPDVACLESCLEMAKKANYDLLLGLGGGSSMDIASLTSIMLTNPGTVYDYFGVNLVKIPGVPTILIQPRQERVPRRPERDPHRHPGPIEKGGGESLLASQGGDHRSDVDSLDASLRNFVERYRRAHPRD